MLLSRAEIVKLRKVWQTGGKRVVFTNGCFDLLHLGHIRYLEEARTLGDILVIGLNSDSSVRQLKGPLRPLVSQEERAEILGALRAVDYVVIFNELTAENLVAEIKPDIYVKGGDYSALQNTSSAGKPLPEAEIVQSYGGQVALIPYLPGHSTSELINRIKFYYR